MAMMDRRRRFPDGPPGERQLERRGEGGQPRVLARGQVHKLWAGSRARTWFTPDARQPRDCHGAATEQELILLRLDDIIRRLERWRTAYGQISGRSQPQRPAARDPDSRLPGRANANRASLDFEAPSRSIRDDAEASLRKRTHVAIAATSKAGSKPNFAGNLQKFFSYNLIRGSQENHLGMGKLPQQLHSEPGPFRSAIIHLGQGGGGRGMGVDCVTDVTLFDIISVLCHCLLWRHIAVDQAH
jgi:hypothetical protein